VPTPNPTHRPRNPKPPFRRRSDPRRPGLSTGKRRRAGQHPPVLGRRGVNCCPDQGRRADKLVRLPRGHPRVDSNLSGQPAGQGTTVTVLTAFKVFAPPTAGPAGKGHRVRLSCPALSLCHPAFPASVCPYSFCLSGGMAGAGDDHHPGPSQRESWRPGQPRGPARQKLQLSG